MKPEDIKYIVVHCSKTPKRLGDDFNVVERKCRLRGALSCGYHFVITREGGVIKGRDLSEAGNHIVGFNANSVAVCLIGMPGRATDAQRKSLRTLLDILREKFPAAQAVTHEELQPGTARGCPGFKL